MDKSENLLAFLDMLDLDEELVDCRLKTIMERSNYSNKHLFNAIQLLQYKILINLQEKTECDNRKEIEFVAKLIKKIDPDIVDNVCKITENVLNLNTSTLVSNSQHLLQQILSNIDVSPDRSKPYEDEYQSNNLFYFRVADSILDAVISQGLKIDLLFITLPLERAICDADEKVKIHFITRTVPKLFEGTAGFNILDRIWMYIKEINDTEVALKVLSSLSDYYLPVVHGIGKRQFQSEIVCHHEFWTIMLSGLLSTHYTYRKISVYLAKRAIDYLTSDKKNMVLKNEDGNLFSWDPSKTDKLKTEWDNFFILFDSLEEKQSNIVLPSLQLFDSLTELQNCWLNCAFKLGLLHDNSQVRLKCVEHRLKMKVNNVKEAIILIQALDDINFYESTSDLSLIKEKITEMLRDSDSLKCIIEAIPQANLSPVPLYHLTDVLAETNFDISFTNDENASQIITELLKTTCNVVTLRKAIHINISHFVGKSCKGLGWRVYAKVFSQLQFDPNEIDQTHNPLFKLLENKLTVNEEDTIDLYRYGTSTAADIHFSFLYLHKHSEDINLYTKMITEKIENVKNVVSRQYSNKLDCLNDVLIILNIFRNCKEADNEQNKEKCMVKEIIKTMIKAELKITIQYVFCLLTGDIILSGDESKSLLSCFLHQDDVNDKDTHEVLIELYKKAVLILRDSNTELERATLSMFIINKLSDNIDFVNNNKHEMLSIMDLLDVARIFDIRIIHKNQSIGKTKNLFYEKHSETMNTKLEDGSKLNNCLKDILEYIEKIVESGGYGCLYWVLNIINKTLDFLINLKEVKFDVKQFINRVWTEIDGLKSNNHYYSPCMKEFTRLLIHNALLEKPEFNNMVTVYCNKIIEYGPVNNSPLASLIDSLLAADFSDLKDYGHIVYIIGELLLFYPVSRKDQRIIDNIAIEIFRNKSKYHGFTYYNTDLGLNFEIHYTIVHLLTSIRDSEPLSIISTIITNKIDEIFKHKVRYHGNSQIHRTIQTGLQHLLFIMLLNTNAHTKNKTLDWCLHLLGKMPHQHSVRICLEWYISVSLYIKKQTLNEQLLDLLNSRNIPLQSKCSIMYWLLRRKISTEICTNSEYEFVLDTLLGHTMGQMFNIRLFVQYLSKNLYEMYRCNENKYAFTIKIINKTLAENSEDKSLMKLKEDYFVNKFDVIANLTPCFLYNALPKLCESNNGELCESSYGSFILELINQSVNDSSNCSAFKQEWIKSRIKDEDLYKIKINTNIESKVINELEKSGTLQKKYIPWKNMSDVNVYETTKKRESQSRLIVVASLIDKLPNLGGMARTSEVFGVKTYVINSLRHLQDKQFQGLSVSAERWIDVEQIRPGQALKDYLNMKKVEGYTIVAAEQTSTGTKLQNFKFPRKTVLLLGHEKDGVPCDLLPMMDYCVEIPQQGFVRSLNVHVTAAIFIWEYARQNLF